jgi:two-component system, chemotaxis family, CheB/CheR fusion protein
VEKELEKPGTENISPKAKSSHYIVAIGASAGGLDALQELFESLPADTGLSFVIIQHLSPDYKSLLPELLARNTQMQVQSVEDDMMVQRNHVYVIPSKKLMAIKNGRLRLTDKSSIFMPNNAIDIFFESLAEEKKDKAIGIILSGAGTDGTRGIEAIKNKGGFVMVQDPISAKFDGMPNSAILSGCADVTLPPELMADELLSFSKRNGFSSIKPDSLNKADNLLLQEILKLINHHTNKDFTNYKLPTLARRVIKRTSQLNIKSLRDYVGLLLDNKEEINNLSKQFLIGVTKFFRDELAFEILRKRVVPAIFESKKPTDTLKIWVAGCSTGEEAYSIGILCLEYIRGHGLKNQVKIFASDIDKDALEIAAKGIYPETIVNDISEERLNSFFYREGNSYIVKPDLRKMVVFAEHDVIKNPPFSKLDLVSCRNLLIYMDSVLQQKVLSTFHFGLNPGGYLFLGSSENIGGLKNSMAEVNKKWKIFKSVGPPTVSSHFLLQNPASSKINISNYKTRNSTPGFNIQELLNETISEEFGFAGVLVDDNYELKQATGDFKRFLKLPEKNFIFNLLKMVPQELCVPLSTGIRKAFKTKQKVSFNKLKINDGGVLRLINIIIRPIGTNSGLPAAAFVIFNEVEAESVATVPVSEFSDETFQEQRIMDLEHELKEMKENLQALVEELETSNEELHSSNEELISSNEELQSTNEELQSLNEELHTVNTEHQEKIKELIELNDDLNNIFRSNEIGQIFLDKELKIRKFTPAITQQVNLLESDIGRPFTHLTLKIQHKGLVEDINKVIAGQSSLEKEVHSNDGKIFLMKIVQYLKLDCTIDGAVVTFIDITLNKKINSLLTKVLDSSSSAILSFNAIKNEKDEIVDFQGVLANIASKQFLGLPPEKFSGKCIVKDKLKNLPDFSLFLEVVEKNQALSLEQFSPKENKHIKIHAVKLDEEGLVVFLEDISEVKNLLEERERNYQEILLAKEKLTDFNSKLEQRIKHRTKELTLSEDRFKLLSKATNDAVWDWDMATKKIWWNDGYSLLFGYNPQYVSSGNNSWYDLIHPSDYLRIISGIDEVIYQKGEQWHDEFRFLKADGTYSYVLGRAYVIYNNEDEAIRMVGSMIDLTEMKKAQFEAMQSAERTKFIAESMPGKVFTADEQGNITYMNKRWLEYTGLPFNKLEADGWLTCIHRDDEFETKRLWDISLETGKDFQFEHRIIRNDGYYRWHISRAVPSKDSIGNIIGWVATTIDIHDKIVSEERKDEFIGIASHELKTPLTSLKAYTQLLEKTIEAENLQDSKVYIKKTNTFINRLNELISDLLDVSKIQAGKLQFNVTEFDFDEFINESVESIRQINKTHEIKVSGKTGLKINADKARLEQVVVNYLTNAIKYSPYSNKVEVNIFKDSNEVKVSVRDYGIGIPNEKIGSIFKRFYRVEGMAHKFQGLGLGLYISSQIVERHGGKCWVESKEDEGSVFWFSLPKTIITM